MTIGCNIWMICLKLNWFFYGLSRMLQFFQFVWTPCYSVWEVFNNFLLIDATDRSKISSNQKRFFIALSALYPLSFLANTPFRMCQLSLIFFINQWPMTDLFWFNFIWTDGLKEEIELKSQNRKMNSITHYSLYDAFRSKIFQHCF